MLRRCLLWCGVAAFCGSAVFVILPTGDRVSVRGREHILRDDLGAMRWGIRQFKVTNGGLPRDLQDLVDAGLLRGVPHDPITGSDTTWTLMRNQGAEVVDVRSGAEGMATDGTRYADW